MPINEDTLSRVLFDSKSNFIELSKILELDPENDFRCARLIGVDLRDQDLSGFDFRQADLSRSDLRGAKLQHAQIIGAQFGGALVNSETTWPPGSTPVGLQLERTETSSSRVKVGANIAEAERRIAACAAMLTEELDLGGLRLKMLPENLFGLTWLKRLYLGGNAELREAPQQYKADNESKRNLLTAIPNTLPDVMLQLETLDLGHNKLTDLPSNLASSQNLTFLNLINNNIGAKSTPPLAALFNLTRLDLGGNNIGAEGVRVLAALTNLSNLNVSGNSIGDEGIRSLATLTGLTSLNLSDNNIGDDGISALAALTKLTSLNLSGNRIGDEGIRSLAALTGLTSLNLSDNGIGNRGISALAAFTNLTSLNLTYNSIGSEGTRALATLTNLTSLDLSGSGIGDEGAKALAALCNLISVDLSDNSIGVEGAKALAALPNLTSLNLSGNSIGVEGARALAALTNLTNLNLSNNDIGAAGARALAALPNLTSLNLSDNGIGADGAMTLAALPKLTSLDLSGNSIGDEGAVALATLTRLTSLNLDDNSITSVTPFLMLTRLQSIKLSNNQIEDITENFWFKPLLNRVILYEAKLGDVPAEVLSSATNDNCLQRLQAHLRDLEAGAELLTDIKFMVLGNGRIGKTQICRRLRGENFDKTVDSTHGIFISEATLPQQRIAVKTGSNGQEAQIRLWDFGGQDIYLGTHTLFLRSRALFAIVWTPTSEKRGEHIHNDLTFRNYPLDYWVQYIQQMADQVSPVVFIQNQVDSPRPPQQLPVTATLVDRFVWHKSIDYSAKTKNGHPILIDTLHQALAYLRTTQGEQRIGKVRAAVKRRLEAMQQRAQTIHDAKPYAGQRDLESAWITKASFNEICAEEGGVASPDLLLEYLHQIGTVFYRKDLFSGRIIIDQQWALDAIYAVFERNSGAYRYLRDIRGGRFTREELAAHIWTKLGHGNAEQDLFISMMRSCGICFRLRDGDDSRKAEYVAPDLLPPRDEIAGLLVRDWNEAVASECASFAYELLPPGLMRSLMAHVGEDAGTRADYWQDGFYFYDSQTKSRARVELVRADDDTNKGWSGRIEIHTQTAGTAQTNGARELLQQLCKLINEMQNRHGITASEFSGPKWCECFLEPGRAARKYGTLPSAEYRGQLIEVESSTGPAFGRDKPGQLHLQVVPGYEPITAKEYYVSYAWSGNKTKEDRLCEKAIDELCAKAETSGIRIVRDKHDMQFGDSISSFMAKIAEAQHIIVIISAKYLRSPYCMYELHEIYRECLRRNDMFRARIRGIVLPDADIFGPIERIKHAEYWNDERKKLNAEIKRVGVNVAGMHAIQHQRLIESFALDTSDVLAMVADMFDVQRVEDIQELILHS